MECSSTRISSHHHHHQHLSCLFFVLFEFWRTNVLVVVSKIVIIIIIIIVHFVGVFVSCVLCFCRCFLLPFFPFSQHHHHHRRSHFFCWMRLWFPVSPHSNFKNCLNGYWPFAVLLHYFFSFSFFSGFANIQTFKSTAVLKYVNLTFKFGLRAARVFDDLYLYLLRTVVFLGFLPHFFRHRSCLQQHEAQQEREGTEQSRASSIPSTT
jgi:hypothetical protein